MEGHIYIYGEITSYQGADAEYFGATNPKMVQDAIQGNKDATDLVVHINSVGGDVDAGFAIFDILKTSGKNIVTLIEGQCYSIATVIALAGTTRKATQNSEFLIHNPWTLSAGDADALEKRAEEVRKLENKIAEHYSAITSITKENALEEMKKDTFMDLEQAKTYGFITEIIETVKAVARFDTNTNKMSDNKKDEGVLEKIKALFNPKEDVKNVTEKDAVGNDVVFNERTEGEIQVGDKATINGEVATGEVVMASGKTYVFENGVLNTIKPKEEKEEAKTLDVNALVEKAVAATVEALKPEMDKKDLEISNLKKKINENNEMFEGLKNIVSDSTVDSKESKKSTSDKTEKVAKSVFALGLEKIQSN